MKTTRLQFEIPEDRLEALDAIMREAGVKTRTELFNNAMTLLKWAVRQRKDGRVVASVDYDDKSFRELVMPILEDIGDSTSHREEAATASSRG